ncbi:unnamed protein product [Acanthoscelides obtectus]|uniref:Uncharacterized protein n=1 Tax=Acanthoscelides obtectus TaxID=200917 RepID=A0A9P0KYX5_ACAOB|nr:unnamed protein product [Acanthoscelides obtectus]CAK1666442.1 hypothetical protein AOBTE_LOCUS25332 [Acanthoscelides obtectus]
MCTCVSTHLDRDFQQQDRLRLSPVHRVKCLQLQVTAANIQKQLHKRHVHQALSSIASQNNATELPKHRQVMNILDLLLHPSLHAELEGP